MILLNFSHPLTPAHLADIAQLAGVADGNAVGYPTVTAIPAHADPDQPFAPQAAALADAAAADAGLTPDQWQTEAILVNLPAYNYLAAALLAELHGRMGYFPPVLRLKPVAGSLPPRFEVAEILNLQAIRQDARARR
jgi:hypothetical protein